MWILQCDVDSDSSGREPQFGVKNLEKHPQVGEVLGLELLVSLSSRLQEVGSVCLMF